MGRKALAVITALITSFAIIFIGWMIATKAPFSTPSYASYASHGDLIAYANAAPPLYWVIGLVTYAVAGFAGGFIVTKMARRWSTGGYGLSLLVAVILTAFSVGMYFYWPGPVWFLIGTVVIFVPTAALAHRMAEGHAHHHVPEAV
jgi:hypothetical protein